MRPFVVIALALAACTPQPPRPAANMVAAEPMIVACWEPEKDLVTRVPKGACRGEEIAPEQEAALAEERRRRVRAAMGTGEADPVTAARRLAGTGSGFFVGAGGEALTNEHVVRSCEQVTLTPAGGAKTDAIVVAIDSAHDLALLRARTPAPEIARFASGSAERGGAVVGYPSYGLPMVRPSIVVAGAPEQRLANSADFVAFDGAVRRGHSGSPLLDGAGNVVGVVNATYDTAKFFRARGYLPDAKGFGASAEAAMRFLRANGIEPAVAVQGPTLGEEAVFDKARRFVAQVGCWR
jgi:serine protease Do